MATIKRIGFACKWIDTPDQVAGAKPADKEVNTRATTVAWLNRQTRDVAVERMQDIMVHNIEATRKLVERVGGLEHERRMVRIGSDILPMYTEPTWRWFYQQSDVRAYAATHFAEVGRLARSLDVRLSFHPGQYCVLASDSDDIIERSIDEFEYHVDMARWMGYGATWHDHGFKINVHLSGRGGTDKFLHTLGRLTPEARNLITIENDEMKYGLDYTLAVDKHVALVLDIHHHWINANGDYILATDDRVRRVIDSWRGTRPVLHYSVSREDILLGHCPRSRPDFTRLADGGHKKQHLRAHSDFFWNEAVSDWAVEHLAWGDIMTEAKGKNLASAQVHAHAKKLGVI